MGVSLEQLRVSCCDPSGRASPWECRATQSHQVRPEEAQQPSYPEPPGAELGHCQGRLGLGLGLGQAGALPSWGTAKGGTLSVPPH